LMKTPLLSKGCVTSQSKIFHNTELKQLFDSLLKPLRNNPRVFIKLLLRELTLGASFLHVTTDCDHALNQKALRDFTCRVIVYESTRLSSFRTPELQIRGLASVSSFSYSSSIWPFAMTWGHSFERYRTSQFTNSRIGSPPLFRCPNSQLQSP
jgi:hypothetical protein